MRRTDGIVDDGLAGWIEAVRADDGLSCRELGAVGLREGQARRASRRPRGPALAAVTDIDPSDACAMRVYRPRTDPLPVVVYLHGGGFVSGSVDGHDATCRQLALSADAVVVSVNFRLAPEHPGPVAVDDSVRAARWAWNHRAEIGGSRDRGLALAGDSSGAATALLAACRLRDSATEVTTAAMLLLNPNADMTLSYPSVDTEGEGWGLAADDLRWFVEQWVPEPSRRRHPSVNPLSADLSRLPPTVVATAGHDPLRDEGLALVGTLRAGGTDVDHLHYPGLVHGFVQLAHLSTSCAEARCEVFERFATVLRVS